VALNPAWANLLFEAVASAEADSSPQGNNNDPIRSSGIDLSPEFGSLESHVSVDLEQAVRRTLCTSLGTCEGMENMLRLLST
jgi:hypothetical protein